MSGVDVLAVMDLAAAVIDASEHPTHATASPSLRCTGEQA